MTGLSVQQHQGYKSLRWQQHAALKADIVCMVDVLGMQIPSCLSLGLCIAKALWLWHGCTWCLASATRAKIRHSQLMLVPCDSTCALQTARLVMNGWRLLGSPRSPLKRTQRLPSTAAA